MRRTIQEHEVTELLPGLQLPVYLLRCAGQNERIKHLLGHGVQHAGDILTLHRRTDRPRRLPKTHRLQHNVVIRKGSIQGNGTAAQGPGVCHVLMDHTGLEDTTFDGIGRATGCRQAFLQVGQGDLGEVTARIDRKLQLTAAEQFFSLAA